MDIKFFKTSSTQDPSKKSEKKEVLVNRLSLRSNNKSNVGMLHKRLVRLNSESKDRFKTIEKSPARKASIAAQKSVINKIKKSSLGTKSSKLLLKNNLSSQKSSRKTSPKKVDYMNKIQKRFGSSRSRCQENSPKNGTLLKKALSSSSKNAKIDVTTMSLGEWSKNYATVDNRKDGP